MSYDGFYGDLSTRGTANETLDQITVLKDRVSILAAEAEVSAINSEVSATTSVIKATDAAASAASALSSKNAAVNAAETATDAATQAEAAADGVELARDAAIAAATESQGSADAAALSATTTSDAATQTGLDAAQIAANTLIVVAAKDEVLANTGDATDAAERAEASAVRAAASETAADGSATVAGEKAAAAAESDYSAAVNSAAADASADRAESARDAAQSAVSVDYNVATVAERDLLNATQGQTAYVRETGLFYTRGASGWGVGYKGFLQDKADVSTVEKMQLATSSLSFVDAAITRDVRYNWQNGALIASAGYRVTNKIDISDGKVLLVSGVTLGSGAALATYFNAGGAYLGIEQRGLDQVATTFTDFKLSPPVGAATVGICSNGPDPIVRTIGEYITQRSQDELIQESTKGIDSIFAAYGDYNVQAITTVEGAYLNPTNGAVVDNASFIYTKVPVTDSDKIKVSARVNGTGVCLAIYYDSGGGFLGKEKQGAASAEDVVDYALTLPKGTSTVGITSRSGYPITFKKFGLKPMSTNEMDSTWKGLRIDNMGDSNVQQGKWQPAVTASLGCIFMNHGVGGSKIAKPDSAENQVSMCDDARINALDTSAEAWLLGPWGTNDWAQRIPTGTITDTVDTTVYGALNIIAQKVRLRAPTKLVIWVTPFNGDYDSGRSSGWVDGSDNGYGSVAAYAAAIRAVAYKYGFPLIDLNAGCGWNAFNSSYFLLTEGTGNLARIHLNADLGPERIARLMINGLRALQPA